MWKEDLDNFVTVLDELEQIEEKEMLKRISASRNKNGS